MRQVLLYLFFISTVIIRAQFPTIDIQKFGLTEGLFAKRLYNVTSDKNGFIWMSSENGVFRFDGKTFKNYTLKDGLCDNEILKVFVDSKNRIWCSGYNGKLSIIEYGKAQPVETYNKTNHTFIFKFLEAPNRMIYLLGDKSQLYKIDTNLNITSIKTPTNNIFESIFISNNKKYLTLLSPPYLFFLDDTDALQADKNFELKIKNTGLSYAFKQSGDWWYLANDTNLCNLEETISVSGLKVDFKSVKIIKQIHKRYLLFSLLNGRTLLFDKLSNTSLELQSLNGEIIQDIHEDTMKNVWLTSASGSLYRLLIQQPSKAFEGLLVKGHFMSAFFSDKRIAAIDFDNYLHVLTPYKQTKVKLETSTLFRINIFYAAFQKHGDAILLNTESGLFKTEKERFDLILKAGIKQFTIHQNILYYIGPHGLFKFDLSTQGAKQRMISPERFYGLLANNQTLWISKKEGLFKMPFSDTVLSSLIYEIPKNGRIETLTAWQGDTIAIGTSNQGIILFSGNKVVREINTHDGLFDNTCKELKACESGWIVRHNIGLSYVSKKNKSIRTTSFFKNIPISSVNALVCFKDSLVLSTTSGLYKTSIHDLFDERPETRTVQILNIENTGTTLQGNHLQLAHDRNNLSIEFALPEYDNPHLVQYQWRINSSEWNSAYANTVNLSNLNEGEYTLQLRAKAPGFVFSNVSELYFKVTAPFWKSPYFFFSVLIVFLLLYIWWQWRRFKQRNYENTVRLQLLSYEQKALNAMMNPHFIFNALGSIQYHLNAGNTSSADTYLVKFSRLIRRTLEMTAKESCLLSEEIERLTLYLQLEKMRMEDRMDFKIYTSFGIDEHIVIPTMILQTYVENAVIHGIQDMEKTGIISIHFEKEKQRLKITIEDNGKGFSPQAYLKTQERIGLSATAKRLELLSKTTGKAHTVSIISPLHAKGGTCVEIFFPIVTS